MKTKKMILVVSALLTFSFLPAVGGTAPEANLPPDSIGYIRIADAEGVLSDLARFAEKLQIPDASLIFFRMCLERILSIPDLSGVNLNGPLGFILFNLKEEKDPWAVCFSLSNPEACRKALAKSLTLISEDKESGVRIYAKQVKIFDTKSFRKATPEEKKDFQKFFKMEEEKICLALRGKNAWLTKNPALIDSVKDLKISDFTAPLPGNITLVFQPEIILQLIREEYAGKPLPGGAGETPGFLSPFSPAFSRKIFETYLDFYLDCARQIRTAALGVTINADGVSLETLIRAEPESPLAEFLRGQKTGELSLARYLDSDAWLVVADRIRKPEMLLEAYQKLFSILAQTSGPLSNGEKPLEPDKIKEIYLKSMQPYFKAVGEEMAFSISSSFPGNPLSMLILQELKDEAEYRSYIRQSLPETYESLKPFYEKMGITYDFSGLEEPRKYRGTEIYSVKIQFDWKQLQKKEPVGPEEKKIYEAWLNKPMLMEMTIWKGLGITSLSWGGGSGTDSLLDALAKGESTFDLKRLSDCGAETNGVIYFSLNRFFRWLNQLMAGLESDASEAGEKGLADLQKLTGLDLPLLVCVRVEGESLRAGTQIPVERIKAFHQITEKKASAPEKSKP